MVKASLSKAGRGARRRSITSGNDLSEIYFAPLDGTAQEAQSIKTMFPEASVLTGSQATESALKTVVAPRILHIATHGFFLSTAPATLVSQSVNSPAKAYSSMQTSSTRAIRASTTVTNPLLRSGLALAGANLRHENEIDDGILTALEATGLNLWGTKLVVLSACDTGIGEVRNGEGVYGLRRAFLLAGAESLVMSLWPASDYTTRELMTGYYRNLKAGMGRGTALREVQLNMLRHNPKLHPFYWANFIQNGEWADLNGKR
jgi:CHAT domain-containing protein